MSILKWTSPIRQGGLGPIPNEVYMEIFSHLRFSKNRAWIDLVHRREFSRVALVCRFFASLMLPWMFESFERFILLPTPFCRSIINDSGSAQIFATYIKRCSFSWIWIPDPDHKDEFQTLYSTALSLMPNVEELNLSHVRITKHMLGSMVKLERLTRLTLDKCSFLEAKDEDICKLSVLRLKFLRFFIGFDPLQTPDDDSLFIPSVCLDSLLTLHTNCESFVTRIAEQDCHLPLQELDLSGVLDMELLPKVFQKIPALKKLSVFDVETSQHEVQFGHVLPVLEELSCPISLLRSLVPGRPISSITFTMVDWQSQMIDIIQTLFEPSTSRIRSLSIPGDVYQEVSKHFSDLESLRLEFPETYLGPPSFKQLLNEYISNISQTWPRNSPIQELQIDVAFEEIHHLLYDLEWQHKIISTIISPKLPQLCRTTISDCVVWNKIQEDDVWRPSLRVSSWWFALQLESDEADDAVDYHGFFEQILSSAEELWST